MGGTEGNPGTSRGLVDMMGDRKSIINLRDNGSDRRTSDVRRIVPCIQQHHEVSDIIYRVAI